MGHQIHVPCMVQVESDGPEDLLKHKDKSSSQSQFFKVEIYFKCFLKCFISFFVFKASPKRATIY